MATLHFISSPKFLLCRCYASQNPQTSNLTPSSTTMSKIVEKLKKHGYIYDSPVPKEPPLLENEPPDDVFHSKDAILPDYRSKLTLNLAKKSIFPWEKTAAEKESRRKQSVTFLAEMTLPEGELRRLRHLGFLVKSKVKIKKSGVTKEIVELIHEKWRTEEVVRIKYEGLPTVNMKVMHEVLERKTGGLVIWRSGTSISLYRGVTYKTPQPVERQYETIQGSAVDATNKSLLSPGRESMENDSLNCEYDSPEGVMALDDEGKGGESPPKIKYEDEIDKLLDELGPRYTDWPGKGPPPVDADLLPGIVPGYESPFRRLPYGVKRSLGYLEGTALRKLARVIPPHFSLGRSRQYQGLAQAIVKLWEKSCIAKIALKRGVPPTTSERMAEDIKTLTGGSIMSRTKDYIVLYRGKDFLLREVTDALLERERLANSWQDDEEKARLKASSEVLSNVGPVEDSGIAGTLEETLEANARWGNNLGDGHAEKMTRAAEMARHATVVRKLEKKLLLAENKIMKASKALAKVEESLKPIGRETDPESITEEERYMLRKLGLKMKAFLLLGRRGVFDGTVENMHLHWKYRELVKIIVKAKSFNEVKNVALALEAESGGVLVSVDKISKGFAIIVYRGHDYHRPPNLRPKNLLSKRKALARSIELQRSEALNQHILKLQKNVKQLRSELAQMESVKDKGDGELYSKLDFAYSTEDEEDENTTDYLDSWVAAEDVNSDVDGEPPRYIDEDDNFDGDSEIEDFSDDDTKNLYDTDYSSANSLKNEKAVSAYFK